MPILQPVQPTSVLREMPGTASDRPLVRVLLADDGHAGAFDLRRLIAADPDLLDVGQPVVTHDTLRRAQDLQPDVVLLDRTLSYDLVLLARELTSLDRPPAVVVRSDCPEPVMTIAAIVAGVRGIVSRSDPGGAVCHAIRWVAGNRRWFPDIPLSALSRVGARLNRNDLSLLLMLLKGTPVPDIAGGLGITTASLDVRCSAMLRDILGEPPPASRHRTVSRQRISTPAEDVDQRIAIAA